jgi:hypothetical protein
MPIEPTAIFKWTCDCETSHMPDGVVLYHAEAEKVHYLNPTAAIVYELCGSGQSLMQIADRLRASFMLPQAPLHEVQACIEQLVAEGLIEPCRT